MAEPSPKIPRVFASNSLEDADIQALNQLEAALAENPLDYYSHVGFITILHRGLQAIVTEDADDGLPEAPHRYDLLPLLREAYKAMDSRYPLGERIWEWRIQDEKTLVRNIEDRMAVLELCAEATREEPYSAKLWAVYGDYISQLVACAWGPYAPEQWSEDDIMMGKELFTPDMMMDVWQRGAEFVKYDLRDSRLVWDRYLQLLMDDLERQPTPDRVRRVASIFNDRLKQPHETWGDTMSKYSNFNSRYFQENYEAIMEQANSQHASVRNMYALRREFEFNLDKAIQSEDQTTEFEVLTRYLKWEKKTIGVASFPLINALYERAHVRFPVVDSLWEDHVEFLVWQSNRSVSLLEVLERATRHCPWSGSLWSHRILTLEAENHSHEEIEHVKHSATKTGMLEQADTEELMKVQVAWCGYLRRKAFDDTKATEDDADIAEIGIQSALELVHENGKKKYGKAWNGDPKYRLERIFMKYWTQRGNLDEARSIWESLVKKQEDSYDFWYRYYIWEMVAWSKHAMPDKSNPEHQLQAPTRATAVLEQGLKRLTTIDHPEPLIEMYVNHCEQHESVLKVRQACIDRRRSELIVAMRRQKEREAAEEAAAQQNANVADGSGKRKREEDAAETNATAAKKTKAGDTDSTSVEAPARMASEAPSAHSTTAMAKRDREHTTVIVKNLPVDTTQTRIRQFFTDAGTVRNITMKPERDTITATVEFELPEEADYALLKAAKGFEGHPITITRGESTTLYVTNYPPHADGDYLKKLFAKYGDIIDIRFPSLKFDTHRRFCYVQFVAADSARAASDALNKSDVEGLQLVALISDPNAKRKRQGATDEGREVYVRQLTYTIKKSEIEEAFKEFGPIDNINLPTVPHGMHKGNNKGFCFIQFQKKEDAEKAVQAMHGKEMKGYHLHVEIAKPKGETKPKIKTEILNADGDAKDSTTEDPKATDGKNATAVAPVADRTIALLNIPDTVTDARIRTLVSTYPYKKITLMPQHGGAIVEFADVASVGKASLALEGMEMDGRKIRVGTVAELKKEKAEFKKSGFGGMKPVTVNRPKAAAPRGGSLMRGRGRGKAGLGHHVGGSSAKKENEKVGSNEDFRAMLLGGKGKEEPDTEMGDAA